MRRIPFFPLAGLMVVVLAAIASLWLVVSQARAGRATIHTVQVEASLAETLEHVSSYESALRGFIFGSDPTFLRDMRVHRRRIEQSLGNIATLTVDNPGQQRDLRELRTRIWDKITLAEQRVAILRSGRRSEALALGGAMSGRNQMVAVRAVVDRMMAEEQRLLNDRQNWLGRVTLALSLGLVAAVAVVVVTAALTVTDARRRTRLMEDARDAERLATETVKTEMSAREAAESQIRQMQKMESVGQLTGGIAHDFNNMLAIVIGSLDMATRRASDPERLGKCLANAREGAERAAALTARLLAFSRQSPLAPVALDPNRLVSGMSELLRRTLGETIAVETVLAGGLWRTFADPGQLENALLNLAVNARDAMPDGGRLTIETGNAYLDDEYARQHNEVTPGQYALISMSDTGTGMTRDVIERAFDPFFTTKEVGRGTGLGLSQVFGFAKQSGGHVSIYSELDEGTTVKLYLPRSTGPVAEAHNVIAELEAPSGRADEIILVVEDEQRVRHFSVDALRELGYTAISAGGGREALELLREQPSISLLFTDIVMPEMNGRRLADEAIMERPGLKILYTTGYTRNAVVHNGVLDAGVAFLPKPFTINQLARKVREVLDGGGFNRAA